MQFKHRQSQLIVDVIPAGDANNQVVFKDLQSGKLYRWVELEPLKVQMVSQNSVAIGVPPIHVDMNIQGSMVKTDR